MRYFRYFATVKTEKFSGDDAEFQEKSRIRSWALVSREERRNPFTVIDVFGVFREIPDRE